ncbi:MAG: helix-turn-helix transcriptional regulator [Muribaculaceae bacterium]|nr:helix-turn-helix transcriptional regulator [Muribaculaceae bacterium]
MMKKACKQIGEIAKQLRKEKNLTQEQLSKLANVSVRQISKIENGWEDVSIRLISRVFGALGVSVRIELGPINNIERYMGIIYGNVEEIQNIIQGAPKDKQ